MSEVRWWVTWTVPPIVPALTPLLGVTSRPALWRCRSTRPLPGALRALVLPLKQLADATKNMHRHPGVDMFPVWMTEVVTRARVIPSIRACRLSWNALEGLRSIRPRRSSAASKRSSSAEEPPHRWRSCGMIPRNSFGRSWWRCRKNDRGARQRRWTFVRAWINSGVAWRIACQLWTISGQRRRRRNRISSRVTLHTQRCQW
mmetsp:Transcript_34788/g.92894  ORF Transcript_34788/g.92894 Transcript_34788/m.92894 type:complete len:202 (-) Transcript_34788:2222-2827(-)